MSNGEEREVGVRSVERAISILDLLAQGGWRTGADVARELHVHRSTALRLLGTLERHALVELDQVTPHTITARAELESQLDAARTAGVAHTYEELEVGLDAIAAPVFGADGDVVAALDVSGPSHRLRAAGRPDLDRLTKEGAADISRRLGYRGRRSET